MPSSDQNSALSSLGINVGTMPSGGGPSSSSKAPSLGVPAGFSQPPIFQGGPGEGPGGMADPGMTSGSATNPTGYTPFGTVPVSSTYTEADAWAPATDFNQIPILQAEMVQAGLISAKTIRPGVWDNASADAYKQVLAFAFENRLSPQDALTFLVANPRGGAAGGTGSGASSFQQLGAGVGNQGFNYFFPEYPQAAIDVGFRNAAQALTGTENGGMLPQFTAAFKAAEQQAAAGKDIAKSGTAQRGTTGAQAAQRGILGTGQYEQKPSPTDFAQSYLIQHDPSQVMAYGVASRMNAFLNMLGVK